MNKSAKIQTKLKERWVHARYLADTLGLTPREAWTAYNAVLRDVRPDAADPSFWAADLLAIAKRAAQPKPQTESDALASLNLSQLKRAVTFVEEVGGLSQAKLLLEFMEQWNR